MIEAQFYSGSKNESAYECGFITDMINNGLKDSVLINPSPFLVREANCRKYIVIDEYIKNAYKREFKGKDFIRVQGFEPVIPIICYNSYQ